MKVSCTSCGKPLLFDDARFGDRDSVKVRCPACKAVVSLDRPAVPAAPARGAAAVATAAPAATPTAKSPAAPAEPSGPPTQKLKRDEVIATSDGGELLLPMPQDRRISLAILSGKASGQIVTCQRSRVILGRSDSDVVVEDDEVSRRHAVIEIREDRYFLKDLGSTNGTFVDERKISDVEIFDKGEFRIGTTQIMLIVTPNEEL